MIQRLCEANRDARCFSNSIFDRCLVFRFKPEYNSTRFDRIIYERVLSNHRAGLFIMTIEFLIRSAFEIPMSE